MYVHIFIYMDVRHGMSTSSTEKPSRADRLSRRFLVVGGHALVSSPIAIDVLYPGTCLSMVDFLTVGFSIFQSTRVIQSSATTCLYTYKDPT